MDDDRRGGDHLGDDLGDHLGDDVILLVLGEGEPSERARHAVHVARCPECRREYDTLVDAVGEVLHSVPPVQPRLGFDSAVVDRLAADGRSERSWRWMWLAAAAAVLLVLVPSGAWVIGRDDGGAAGAGSVAALRLTADGAPVGTVSIAEVAGRRVMVVAIVEAPSDVAYFCRTRFADGSTADSSAWSSGTGAWIVPLPDGRGTPVVAVEVLPAGSDHVWSAAAFA
jgi:anti-sigma factor RsiW